MKKTIFIILIVFLLGVFGYSVYQISLIHHNYSQEAKTHSDTYIYKPESISSEAVKNQSIVDAINKNPDVVGWLTIDNTDIDYIFVKADDNEFYLHRDINKDYSYAGTIFMDNRFPRDFSSFNTILYGHNMNNGSMFGALIKFKNKDFFEANYSGTIYLADKTYKLKIFAVLVVKADDEVIYGTVGAPLDYIKSKATHYKDINILPDEHIITFSTCSYEFKDARTVVIAKLDAK